MQPRDLGAYIADFGLKCEISGGPAAGCTLAIRGSIGAG